MGKHPGHKVFENIRKSLYKHCERSELRLQNFVKNVQIVKKDIWELFVMIKSAARMDLLLVKHCCQTG